MEKTASPSLDRLLAIKAEELTTLIDSGVTIEGVLRVTSGKSVLISGEVVGGIISNGSIVINEGGVVVGSIVAKSLQVSGLVRAGRDSDFMDIEGPIVLTRTAVIACDAVSDGVQTEFGCVMNGRFRPREESAPSRASEGAAVVQRAEATASVRPVAPVLQAVQRPEAPRQEVQGEVAGRFVG